MLHALEATARENRALGDVRRFAVFLQQRKHTAGALRLLRRHTRCDRALRRRTYGRQADDLHGIFEALQRPIHPLQFMSQKPQFCQDFTQRRIGGRRAAAGESGGGELWPEQSKKRDLIGSEGLARALVTEGQHADERFSNRERNRKLAGNRGRDAVQIEGRLIDDQT